MNTPSPSLSPASAAVNYIINTPGGLSPASAALNYDDDTGAAAVPSAFSSSIMRRRHSPVNNEPVPTGGSSRPEESDRSRPRIKHYSNLKVPRGWTGSSTARVVPEHRPAVLVPSSGPVNRSSSPDSVSDGDPPRTKQGPSPTMDDDTQSSNTQSSTTSEVIESKKETPQSSAVASASVASSVAEAQSSSASGPSSTSASGRSNIKARPFRWTTRIRGFQNASTSASTSSSQSSQQLLPTQPVTSAPRGVSPLVVYPRTERTTNKRPTFGGGDDESEDDDNAPLPTPQVDFHKRFRKHRRF
ncbi:hypothetical protein CF319_g7532 [Tilletia indica]|nr:hypothetical protein CF319_g7532 [Tilletia indica]